MDTTYYVPELDPVVVTPKKQENSFANWLGIQILFMRSSGPFDNDAPPSNPDNDASPIYSERTGVATSPHGACVPNRAPTLR